MNERAFLGELPYVLSVALVVALISLGVHAYLRDAPPRTEKLKVGTWYCCLDDKTMTEGVIYLPTGGGIAVPAGP